MISFDKNSIIENLQNLCVELAEDISLTDVTSLKGS